MTIQDFDQALQEQGSEIQQAFGMLRRIEVGGGLDDGPGWTAWYQP